MIWRLLGSKEGLGFLTIALVIPILTWGLGILAVWQSLLLVFGLLAAQLGILALGTRVTIMIWVMVAAVLIVGTQVSLFWTTSTPDAKVDVTITSLRTGADCRVPPGGCITYYDVNVVDENGRRYKLSVSKSEWKTLSRGAMTSVTYHDRVIGGRWFPRRVVTQLGDYRLRSGRGSGLIFFTLISAVPAGALVYFIRESGSWDR